MADDEAMTNGTTRRPPQEIVATCRHAQWVTDVAGHGLTVLTLVGHTAPVFARTALGDGLGLPVYGTVVLAPSALRQLRMVFAVEIPSAMPWKSRSG